MSDQQGIDVSILGREFKIACPKDEQEGLMKAVTFLDKKMRDIRDAGKIANVERIAIMAALNLAHELLTTRSGGVDIGDLKRRITLMQEQIDDVVAEQNKLF